VYLLLTAARDYYEIAERTTDQQCKIALIYLGASILQRVRVVSEPKWNGDSQYQNSQHQFDIRSNRHSFDGRLTISAARKEVKGIKEVDNSFDRLDLALICYYVYILSDQEGFKARLDRCSE
jgi:hypothetical protein